MMSMYGGSNGNSSPPTPQRSNQACLTCKRQKRKCDKVLPRCSLCTRMNRTCDYTDAPPTPTTDDFVGLQRQIKGLEERLNSQMSPERGHDAVLNGAVETPPRYGTPTYTSPTRGSRSSAADQEMSGYSALSHYSLHGIQNKFPSIAFLDRDAFKHGGIAIPNPSPILPDDATELLGDGRALLLILTTYFDTTHKWFPIVSHKRLARNLDNSSWSPGLDVAFLFLAMKLISGTPNDSVEGSGTISLHVLQGALLVTWYEYGHAIYPAAWMTAGWGIRYGDLLGINGETASADLLGRPRTWTEHEERRRCWWGVLVTDRIISIGSQSHINILATKEPTCDAPLPVNDNAWNEGEMSRAIQNPASSAISVPVGPFPRLCQAFLLLGRVSRHHSTTFPKEADRFAQATALYVDIQALIFKLNEEQSSASTFALAAPIGLSFSTLCALCEPYSCPQGSNTSSSPAADEMVRKALDGMKASADGVVIFANHLHIKTRSQGLSSISPIIMDAVYCAATHFAWLVRENGAEDNKEKLEILRSCLKRFGERWHNAAEYLRILEAKEFTYDVRTASG